MSSTREGKSPLGFGWGWLVLVGVAVGWWMAMHVAAIAASSTGWRPNKLHRLVDGSAHLFAPSKVTAGGMDGLVFPMVTLSVYAAILAALIVWVWRWFGRQNSQGLASRKDLAQFAASTVTARAPQIVGRPDSDPRASGLQLGRAQGQDVWLSSEETMLVLAPPRVGKTSRVVAPAVARHRGPVVATGVRSDIFHWTIDARRQLGYGHLWVCDPVGTLTLPDDVRRVRWSPLTGCSDPDIARLRVEALFAALPAGGANDEFWRTEAVRTLTEYFVAAAVARHRISSVMRWVANTGDTTAVGILQDAAKDNPTSLTGLSLRNGASLLEAMIGEEPKYKAGVYGQMRQALDCFRFRTVMEMCEIDEADSFDAHDFLANSGTVWMLGSDTRGEVAAGVCCALTASIIESARARATASGRLRPPLLLALDEILNVAPIPRLEQLLSTGGGSGLQSMIVLQSMAAARNKYGRETGDALLDFNTAKIVLGGLADAQDLQDLSTLLGQRDETTVSASRSGRLGVLERSDYSYSHRLVPVLRPDEIRTIDTQRKGQALVVARSSKGMVISMPSIFELAAANGWSIA
ncbi:MAG: TraM recognition domain-containing protein [Ilumatobacteraceae bacterium]